MTAANRNVRSVIRHIKHFVYNLKIQRGEQGFDTSLPLLRYKGCFPPPGFSSGTALKKFHSFSWHIVIDMYCVDDYVSQIVRK